jgi:signal transduction histidine kinase
MTRIKTREIRLLLGFFTGVLLWLVWQTSAITSPDAESIHYSKFLAGLPPGWMDFFRPWTRQDYVSILHFEPLWGTSLWWTFGKEPATDAAIVHTWVGFLPMACLFGVLFAVLKPLPRFLVWISSLAMAAGIVFYCFNAFQYALPISPPIIVLSCFYLCGTVIYLETEKIERSRNLAIDLQRQAEQERKRIAKDLHDESLQSMSRIVRIMDRLSDELPENPVPKEVRGKLESCISGVRNVINDLHPAQLEEFGLSATFEQLVEEFRNASGIKSKFQDRSSGARFSDFFELCIYRIAQEALNNVEKHSGATEMTFCFELDDRFVHLNIVDNGKGNVQKKQGSYGLRNMIDRAKLVNGEIIWSVPDGFESGTMVSLKIPRNKVEPRV